MHVDYRACASLRPANNTRNGAKNVGLGRAPSTLAFALCRLSYPSARVRRSLVRRQTSRVKYEPRLTITASLLSSVGRREGLGTLDYRSTLVVHFTAACLHAAEGVALGAPQVGVDAVGNERDARPQG